MTQANRNPQQRPNRPFVPSQRRSSNNPPQRPQENSYPQRPGGMYFQGNPRQKPQQFQSNKSPYHSKPVKNPNQSFSGKNNRMPPRPAFNNMSKQTYRPPPKGPLGPQGPRGPQGHPRPQGNLRQMGHPGNGVHPRHPGQPRPPGPLGPPRNKALTVPNGMNARFIKSNSNPMAPNLRPNYAPNVPKMRTLSKEKVITDNFDRSQRPPMGRPHQQMQYFSKRS